MIIKAKFNLNLQKKQMDIRLYFNGGKHMITHEYYTYGTYAFIPDIGGYLVVILWLRLKSIFISMYN